MQDEIRSMARQVPTRTRKQVKAEFCIRWRSCDLPAVRFMFLVESVPRSRESLELGASRAANVAWPRIVKRIHLSILRQPRLDQSRPACAERDLMAKITRLINEMKEQLRCCRHVLFKTVRDVGGKALDSRPPNLASPTQRQGGVATTGELGRLLFRQQEWGASHCFWLGGCDATGPPIEKIRPTQVYESASDCEQSVGQLSTCRTPPSPSKENGMRSSSKCVRWSAVCKSHSQSVFHWLEPMHIPSSRGSSRILQV